MPKTSRFMQMLGQNHPNTVVARENLEVLLAEIAQDQGRPKKTTVGSFLKRLMGKLTG